MSSGATSESPFRGNFKIRFGGKRQLDSCSANKSNIKDVSYVVV
jgi:hypothetical protein